MKQGRFCYWSVASGEHARMMQTCIRSARRQGVMEEFHIWTDCPISDAICHPCGSFDRESYLFKLHFLANHAATLDYDFLVFLDADNYFVRHPGADTFAELLRDNPWFVQLESDCTSRFVQRGDWWGCPIRWYPLLLRFHGVRSDRIYNCNAGFWIVRKEAIQEFYARTMEFFSFCRNELHLVNFTEEPPLAWIGHFVDDPQLNTFANTSQVWASDWTGHFKDRLPNGESWDFEDYMSGQKCRVNPAIVHAMRSKSAMMSDK